MSIFILQGSNINVVRPNAEVFFHVRQQIKRRTGFLNNWGQFHLNSFIADCFLRIDAVHCQFEQCSSQIKTFYEFTGNLGVTACCIAEKKCSCALLDYSSRSTSRTCRRSLTPVIDVLLLPWVLALSPAVVDVFVELTFGYDAPVDFFSQLDGKTSSAPCGKLLWVLRQPLRLHLRWFGHVRNECLPFKQKEQSWFFAAILARCVGVFSFIVWHLQMGCCDLQSTQDDWSIFAIWDCLITLDDFELEANTFEDNSVLNAPLHLVSSGLLLKEKAFMRSWPSGSFFNL